MRRNTRRKTTTSSVFSPDGKKHGIAAADISTGEFVIYETLEPVEDEISRFEPREIVCPKTLKENIHYSEILKNFYTTAHEDWAFDYAEAYRTLLMHFKVSSLDGIWLRRNECRNIRCRCACKLS